MDLESLSNDIFYNIFEYLSTTDLFGAFTPLNQHFNSLLRTYFYHAHQLNLTSITKTQFDRLCKDFLPSLWDQITGLQLSNDAVTPIGINLFFISGFKLTGLPRLTSLSLKCLQSKLLIIDVITQMKELTNLTNLKLEYCRLEDEWDILTTLIDAVWNLPRLIDCELDIGVQDQNQLIAPKVTSLSMKHLSIKSLVYNIEELIEVFQHTPNLEFLQIDLFGDPDDLFQWSPIPLMKTLKIGFHGSTTVLLDLLQHFPSLYHLCVKLDRCSVDGSEWEQIITTHLPNLKRFYYRSEWKNYILMHPKEVLSSFQTPFWLETHGWYVRCMIHHINHKDVFCVHTFPYKSDDFLLYPTPESAWYYSTYPSADIVKPSEHFREFYAGLPLWLSSPTALSSYQNLFHNQSRQLQHLRLSLPMVPKFSHFFPTLEQLSTLTVSLSVESEDYDPILMSQFQILLQQAPKLRSVSFNLPIRTALPLLESSNRSIVELRFIPTDEYFDELACSALILSSLGEKCQVLSIPVKDRRNIMQLITQMSQLHALTVKCELVPKNTDQLFRWLRSGLPAKAALHRDCSHPNDIRLWLR